MAIQSRALPRTASATVLLTRPEAASARFAAALEARFPGRLRFVTAALIAPEWVADAVPERDWTALLLTSETGAEAAGQRRLTTRLPEIAFCVGRRTAEVAKAAGFEARGADGDAAALLALVKASGLPGPMLHLRGRDTRGDLAAALTAAGIEAASVIVYDQVARPLSADAITLLQASAPVIVPVFSPRTAQLLVTGLQDRQPRAPLHLAAISPAVADALAPLPRAALAVADRPDAPAMLAAIGGLLEDSRLS